MIRIQIDPVYFMLDICGILYPVIVFCGFTFSMVKCDSPEEELVDHRWPSCRAPEGRRESSTG